MRILAIAHDRGRPTIGSLEGSRSAANMSLEADKAGGRSSTPGRYADQLGIDEVCVAIEP